MEGGGDADFFSVTGLVLGLDFGYGFVRSDSSDGFSFFGAPAATKSTIFYQVGVSY